MQANRYFSVDTLEAFISPKQQTKPSARTKVGKSIELNHAQLVLASTALIIQIDERLHALRSERPNSAEAIAERDQIVLDYDALRGELEALRQSIADFKTGRTKESDVVKRVDSFSDGVRSWWSKRHEMICDKVLDMSLFLSAVTICSLAGASGNMAVATSAVLVGGKPVVEALKSIGKKLLK